MKKLTLLILFQFSFIFVFASSWVRVNQIGYLEDDLKIAVWVSKNDEKITKFEVIEKSSGKTVYREMISSIRVVSQPLYHQHG